MYVYTRVYVRIRTYTCIHVYNIHTHMLIILVYTVVVVFIGTQNLVTFSDWLRMLAHRYTWTIYSKTLERWIIFATGVCLASRERHRRWMPLASLRSHEYAALHAQTHGPLYMALCIICVTGLSEICSCAILFV